MSRAKRWNVRHHLMVAIPVAIVVVAAVACGYCDPNNKPTPIPGQSNGFLSEWVLTTVSDTCRAETHAGADLRRMLTDAQAAGITLRAAECYRDYAGQVYWRDYWCNLGMCQMAAIPGTSIHGWGKAVDFDELTFDSPAYAWLKDNAWLYGWNHPGWAEPGTDSEEPWHWEWVGDGGTMFSGQSSAAARTNGEQPAPVRDR